MEKLIDVLLRAGITVEVSFDEKSGFYHVSAKMFEHHILEYQSISLEYCFGQILVDVLAEYKELKCSQK